MATLGRRSYWALTCLYAVLLTAGSVLPSGPAMSLPGAPCTNRPTCEKTSRPRR